MGARYLTPDNKHLFSTSQNGTVPKPSAQEVTDNKVLRADGSWVAQSGGGGGTSDYGDLTNKPQINGITLSGNKTGADLSLISSSDLASINITGSTNNTGATIKNGTFFYLNSSLVRAILDIANGATLTSGTNYKTVTAGGLNEALKISRPTITFTNASTVATTTILTTRFFNNFLMLNFHIVLGGAATSAGTNLADLTFNNLDIAMAIGTGATGNAGVIVRLVSNSRIMLKQITGSIPANDYFDVGAILFLD